MNGQHTPGPWAFDGDCRVDAMQFRKLSKYRPMDDAGVEHDYFYGLVALPYSCGDVWTRIANARLIAAAPDLLAALQPFVAHNSSDETVTITVRTADVTRARAAIARATGAAE